MRAIHFIPALLAVVALGAWYAPPTVEKPDAKAEPADPKPALKDVVTTFFKNWENKQPEKNVAHFFSADMPVVRFTNFGSKKVWQEKAGVLMKKWQADPLEFLRLDSASVEAQSYALATVRAIVSRGGTKTTALFTLVYDAEAKAWKIAALVMEEHFVW